MSKDRLCNNLISVIKEAQLKLGYEEHTLGINYTSRSLCYILGCDEAELENELEEFCSQYFDTFGEIEFEKRDGGYRIDVSKTGVEYVHTLLSDSEFLAVFINTVKRPMCTVSDVLEVFKKFSEDIHFEEVKNGEFDYLIYFEDSSIDEFWYCLHEDELQLEYHRFIKEDYMDFDF